MRNSLFQIWGAQRGMWGSGLVNNMCLRLLGHGVVRNRLFQIPELLFITSDEDSRDSPVLKMIRPQSAKLLNMLKDLVVKSKEVSGESPVLKGNCLPSVKLLQTSKTNVRRAEARATF